MGYTIKVVAERTNLSPNTLRYYEKEGLLPNVKRTQSGIRHYSDKNLDWLSLICCLKNSGMSIKQIRDFVDLSLQGPETLKARCEILVAHKKCVEGHISEMNRHLEKVTHKITYFTRKSDEFASQNTFDRELSKLK